MPEKNNIYDICILDDKLPIKYVKGADDTKIIGANTLLHLLANEGIEWEDTDLFEFVKLITKNSNYNPSGFTNHSFFLNHIQTTIFSPDIIIFDWEVGTGGDSSDSLFEILTATYSVIAIFTDQDMKGEVTNEINKPRFESYLKDKRLFLIPKGGTQHSSDLEKELDKRKKFFSFKYSHELKQKTLYALNKTLSNIGSLTFDQFVSIFGEIEGPKRKLSSIDFTDIIIDKIKSELVTIGFNEKELDVNYQSTDDGNLLRKAWHFRLYHEPQDNIVRKGDIIKKNGANDAILYLVLSSDCHLRKFWEKNFGALTLIPLYKVDKSNTCLKNMLDLNKKAVENYNLSSLINPSINNMIILPGLLKKIENGNEVFLDYALLHRNITSIQIPIPKEYNEKAPLVYDNITDYSGNDRYKISDPFLTPLVHFVLENITGYGLPDFSKEFCKSITNTLIDVVKEDIKNV